MKNLKKAFIIISIVFMSVITANAQSYTANLEFYVGTWRYTNASTGEEFTIQLRKTSRVHVEDGTIDCLVGAYTYKKNGQIIVDCINQYNSQIDPLNMPIYATNRTFAASDVNPDRLYMYVIDVGMNKTTFSNDILIISGTDPKKIRWILRNDEGEYETQDLPPTEFSIPTDIVLTKVQ